MAGTLWTVRWSAAVALTPIVDQRYRRVRRGQQILPEGLPRDQPGRRLSTSDNRDQISIRDRPDVHAAWLPPESLRALGSRRVLVLGDGVLAETVVDEVAQACARYGGAVWPGALTTADLDSGVDLVLALGTSGSAPNVPLTGLSQLVDEYAGAIEDEGFALARTGDVTIVLADDPAGLLYGLFHVVRLGESAFRDERPAELHRPVMRRRMLDHWDNIDVHPVMGQVERGYAGASIFWNNGGRRADLSRVRAYARLLAACAVNAIAVNNVNVHATEAHLLTDRLGDVAAIADVLRPYGIRVHLSVSFASPVVLGGLPTADPLDADVRTWWAQTTQRVYETIPDFGGYVVKADSEGQPGRSGTGAATPTAPMCSPTRWPRTTVSCTGAPSSTTTIRTGVTARPTGPGPRTTTSSRSTDSSATTPSWR